MQTLTPIETIALSKAIKDSAVDEARAKLNVGPARVDFTVRIEGDMLVAPRSPRTIKEDVPPATLLALVLAMMTPAARAKVMRYVDTELAAWRTGDEELPTPAAEVSEAAERLCASAHREMAGTKNGSVTAPLNVTLLARNAFAA